MPIPFLKMHGLGNDFVILDARQNNFHPNPPQIMRMADRHRGVGFDQLMVLEAPRAAGADLFMHIYNPDASDGGTCGNATRCVAAMEMDASGKDKIIIDTAMDRLVVTRAGALLAADMGQPRLDWQEIPLSTFMDTLQVDIGIAGLPKAACVSMGNPHAVFFVADADAVDVAALGPKIEQHPLFPKRTNVEFASVLRRDAIRMRVWERGAGITLACGSAACATLVAAVRRGLTDRKAELLLDGGSLMIEWLENNHVLMTGPTALSFSGMLSDALLGVA